MTTPAEPQTKTNEAAGNFMTHDPFEGRRPSGTSVPPELVVAVVGVGMVALAFVIACGVFALNTSRPPPTLTGDLPTLRVGP